MVLIVIAVTALYRWTRGLIQQHAAGQQPQGRTEQADPTWHEQSNERSGRRAGLTPTGELVLAGQQQ